MGCCKSVETKDTEFDFTGFTLKSQEKVEYGIKFEVWTKTEDDLYTEVHVWKKDGCIKLRLQSAFQLRLKDQIFFKNN